ncbi:hypothetical protein C7415_105267 [Cupriavidus alkaliphilus]|nr:hypothetical protein C7415_105267 [Cupriavidus alkaliphilus]
MDEGIDSVPTPNRHEWLRKGFHTPSQHIEETELGPSRVLDEIGGRGSNSAQTQITFVMTAIVAPLHCLADACAAGLPSRRSGTATAATSDERTGLDQRSRYDGRLFAKPVGRGKASRWLFDWQRSSGSNAFERTPSGSQRWKCSGQTNRSPNLDHCSTCPAWPEEVEDACAIDTQDPFIFEEPSYAATQRPSARRRAVAGIPRTGCEAGP